MSFETQPNYLNFAQNNFAIDSMKYFHQPFDFQENDTLTIGRSFQGRKRSKKIKRKECKIKRKETNSNGISPFAFLAFSLISINTVMNIINAINNNNCVRNLHKSIGTYINMCEGRR